MLFLKYIFAPFAMFVSILRLNLKSTTKVCEILCLVFTTHVLTGKEHLKKKFLGCDICKVHFSSKLDLYNHVKGLCFVCFFQAQFHLSCLAKLR